ncbi:MAG: hypothetical protein JWQ59_2190 [Cryobacterium sp.]|jgi:hypothetical protein|nr:hypothetical protein [Cryobacterium sp.]
MAPITDRGHPRPPLPEDAGKNAIRLDLALTRDEIAVTIRQFLAKVNPRRIVTENPGSAVALVLVLAAVAGSAAVRSVERKAEREERRDWPR